MYLSRLHVDQQSRAVRRDLGDLQALHRTIMSAFPATDRDADAAGRVMWRLEAGDHRDHIVLLVQSTAAPDWSRLARGYLADDHPEVKPIDAVIAALAAGMSLRFRLVANPTVKIDTKSGPEGVRRNGRRVPLRGDEALLAWLVRKGADAGFTVGPDAAAAARAVVVRPLGDLVGWRANDPGDGAQRLTLRGAAFDGVLTVTDADRLRAAVTSGIGSGKAYGFGLLSLAPMSAAR